MDPQTLAMLSLLFGGGAGLPEGSSVNTTQDVLFNTILNPQWGMLTGSYDPYLTMPEQQYVADPSVGMPITTSASQGSGTMAEIANGLLSGSMPFDEALRILSKRQTDPKSDVFGMDLAGEVSKIRDEINSYNADVAQASAGGTQQDNVYSKAGLPTPDRMYTAADMPKSARLQSLLGVLNRDAQGLATDAEKYEGPAPMVKMRSAGRQGSPSAAAGKNQPLLGGAPRSAEEARRMAEATGADPDMAEKFFNRAMTAAEASFAYDTIGKSTMDMTPEEAKKLRQAWGGGSSAAARDAFEKSWSRLISGQKDAKTGNPIFDAGSSNTRDSAKALEGFKPSTDRSVMMEFVDPKWLKGRDKYRTRQRVQNQRTEFADAVARGEEIGLAAAGRTPYNDAIQERFGQLAMLRQLGLL